jgi:AcrR family transcriptional regulator
MTPQKANPPSDSLERIYQTATILFSQKGYTGTSIRDIASAVGLSVSTVNYHVGGKETLYREILRRIYEMEYQLFSPFAKQTEEVVFHNKETVRKLIKQIVGVLLNRIIAEPETYRLWTYYFLENSDILKEMDKEFSLPFYQMMLSILQRSRLAGTLTGDDEYFKMFITSIAWMLHGYFNGRKNDWGDPTYNLYQTSNIEYLRNFLYHYVDCMMDHPINQ